MAEDEKATVADAMAQSALKMAEEAKLAQEKLQKAKASLGDVPSLDDLSPEKPDDRKKAKVPSAVPEALAGVKAAADGIQDKAKEMKEKVGDLKVEVPSAVAEDHPVLQDAPTDEAYTPKGIQAGAEEVATTVLEAKDDVADAVNELEVPQVPTDEGVLNDLTENLEVPQAPTDEGGVLNVLADKRDEIGATVEEGVAKAKDDVSAGVDAVDGVVKSPVESADKVFAGAKDAVETGMGAIGESAAAEASEAEEMAQGMAETVGEIVSPDNTHSPADEAPVMTKDTAVEEVVPETEVEGETEAAEGETEEKMTEAGTVEETEVDETTTEKEVAPVPSAEPESETVEELAQEEETEAIPPEASTEEANVESQADVASPSTEDQPVLEEDKPEESIVDSLAAAATGVVEAGTATIAAGTAAVMDMVEEITGADTVEEPTMREEASGATEPSPSSDENVPHPESTAEPPAIESQPTDEEPASEEQKPSESLLKSVATGAAAVVAGGDGAVKDAAEDDTEEVKSSAPSDEGEQIPSRIETKETADAPTGPDSKEIADVELISKKDTDAPDDEVAQDAVRVVTEEEVEEETETPSTKATSDVKKTRDFASEAAVQQEASTLCGCIIL